MSAERKARQVNLDTILQRQHTLRDSLQDPKDDANLVDRDGQFLNNLLTMLNTQSVLGLGILDDATRAGYIPRMLQRIENAHDDGKDLTTPEEKANFFSGLLRFAEGYRRLPTERRTVARSNIGGMSFFKAQEDDAELAGLPKNAKKQKLDASFQYYPDFLGTIANPETNGPVLKWFKNTIKNQRRVRELQGNPIGQLCFIEQDFASNGALTLNAVLVPDTGLPATIYRPTYWIKSARFSGRNTYFGGQVAIIDDVLLSPERILDTARFLKETRNSDVTDAFVMYDYQYFPKGEKSPTQRLAEKGISLHTMMDRATLKNLVRSGNTRTQD